ncbi:c-type cytochrome [Pseudomonadota bacterium]
MKTVTLLITACSLLFAQQLVFAQGEALFKERCSQCHSLPKMDERTPAQLAKIVDVMQEIMVARDLTPLNDNEKSELLAYLETKAKQTDADAENLAEDAFMVRCGLCHQAPDAEMLKINQWKIVLRTMDQRMEKANVPLMDEQERELVLQYLTQHARK